MWALQVWTYTLEALMVSLDYFTSSHPFNFSVVYFINKKKNNLQVVQTFYGTYMASEVAYYTYMYAKVDRSKYQRVTGHARSAILSGRFLSAVLGQVLITTQLFDLRQLNYISFGGKRRVASK